MRLVSTSRLRLRLSLEQFRDSRLRLRLRKCLRRDRDESLVSSRSEKWSRLRVSPTPASHLVAFFYWLFRPMVWRKERKGYISTHPHFSPDQDIISVEVRTRLRDMRTRQSDLLTTILAPCGLVVAFQSAISPLLATYFFPLRLALEEGSCFLCCRLYGTL